MNLYDVQTFFDETLHISVCTVHDLKILQAMDTYQVRRWLPLRRDTGSNQLVQTRKLLCKHVESESQP